METEAAAQMQGFFSVICSEHFVWWDGLVQKVSILHASFVSQMEHIMLLCLLYYICSYFITISSKELCMFTKDCLE